MLGLYFHLAHWSMRIQGKGDKGPYIKLGSGRNQGIMPEVAWGGAIFVAPLGVQTPSHHINLVNAAEFISPLLMERIIC